jgi:hypothetical protein
MKCENYKEQMMQWVNNQLTGIDKIAFDNHLSHCEACQQELQMTQQVWDKMGQMPVPEPSDSMRVRFTAMLDTYKETEKTNAFTRIINNLRQRWVLRPAFQVAYSFLLVVAGLGIGYWIMHKEARPEVQEMKQMLMLSLLENPSASERIRAISYTSEINKVNKPVTDALFTTLNNDPNVNVRLMTLEALAGYAKDPAVREGLIRSIIQQDSPLLQSAIADVMVKLQERRSVAPLKQLLQQKDLNHMVRNKIEKSISQII